MKESIRHVVNVRKRFRFNYIGGGYFRDRNIPKGKKAEVKHGMEVINDFCKELIKEFRK